MDPEFWYERWALGEIGFHRKTYHPALDAHWPANSPPASAINVLVPLCGKTLDIHWLLAQGYFVTGVELDQSAVEALFAEWPGGVSRKATSIKTAAELPIYQLDKLELVVGDFFEYAAKTKHMRFYDRAALIALPIRMRPDYMAHFRQQLSDDAQGLLITYEYDQKQMVGPPFSVSHEELVRYSDLFDFECCERTEVIERHSGMRARGLNSLFEVVYHVRAR